MAEECLHYRGIPLLSRRHLRPLVRHPDALHQLRGRLRNSVLCRRLTDALDRICLPDGAHVFQPYIPADG
jgi:hypothetical protein